MQVLKFEVRKDGLRQNQDGSFKVVFNIHPHENINALIAAEMGQAFECVLVPVDGGQHITIKPTPAKRKWSEFSACQQAGILTSRPEFQRWVGEEDAVVYLRRKCGVQSRKELDGNPEACAKFRVILATFLNDTNFSLEDMA